MSDAEPTGTPDEQPAGDSTEQSEPSDEARGARIDRLMDAIDLIRENKRQQAQVILSEIIGEDGDFEDAWLWLSLAVDTLDQAAVCLDNVLRINPHNMDAAGALYRLRVSEMAVEQRRTKLRLTRDLLTSIYWIVVIGVLFAILFTYGSALGPQQ